MSQGSSFLHDILQLAVDIELECAGVYEVFAKQSGTDDELVAFWRLYAEAERYHAATIRIHQTTFHEAVADGDSFPVEVEASRAFLTQLRTWRDEYSRSKPPLTRMFEVAGYIESHTAELHGRTQFFALYPRFAELFERMAEEDRDHRGLLDTARDRFTA